MKGSALSTATTPPSASEPQSADCGPRTTSIRDSRSLVSSSNRASLPAAGIVEADAVDEQQGVIGLGAADAELGLGAARAGGGDRDAGREPQQIGRSRQIERLDLRLVDHGRRKPAPIACATGSRAPVTMISAPGWAAGST